MYQLLLIKVTFISAVNCINNFACHTYVAHIIKIHPTREGRDSTHKNKTFCEPTQVVELLDLYFLTLQANECQETN